jgi:hypothetical protein
MNRLMIIASASLAIAAVLAVDFETAAPTAPAISRAFPMLQANGIQRVSFAATVSRPAEPEPEAQLPEMDPREAAKRWEKIDHWVGCAKKDNCKIPDNNSREAHFYLRDQILKEGRWFLEHSAGSAEQEKRSRQAATRLLAYPEEQVQGLALRWLHHLPAEAATIGLIENNLSDMVDPELAHLAMQELSRHMGTAQENEALDLVEKLLFEGSIFASREVARSANLVANDGNRGRVERWLSELPPSSAKVRLLQQSLNNSDEM